MKPKKWKKGQKGPKKWNEQQADFEVQLENKITIKSGFYDNFGLEKHL